MYPGYNFITGQMPGQMSPMGQQMSPLGGQQQMQPMRQQSGQLPSMGQMPTMGGQQSPMQAPTLGQGFMQPPLQGMQSGAIQANPQQQGHPGGFFGQFGPMFGLAGMMAGHGGGSMAPLLGGLAGWGLHKAGVF